MRSLGIAIPGVLILICLPGCGKSDPKQRDLSKLGVMYQAAYDKAVGDKKLVGGVKDLKDYPNASAEDKKLADRVGPDGDYVLIWNVDFGAMSADGKELGDYILGYETDAPKEGGYVVYCNGETKKLSAEEFKSAKKAEPAKK